MKINKKGAIIGLASSVILSLTSCGATERSNNVDNNIVNEITQEEMAELISDYNNLSKKYDKLDDNIECLQKEKEQYEQKIESLQDEKEQYEQEIERLKKLKDEINQKKYSIDDLYFLDTSKLGEEIPRYYIISKKDSLNTNIDKYAFLCSKGDCFYATSNSKDEKGEYECMGDVYETVGLENPYRFYMIMHWPKEFPCSSYPTYYTLAGDSISTFSVEFEPGIIDGNPHNKALANDCDNIIVPLKNVLNISDLKPEYTSVETEELMNSMMSGQYNFNEDSTPKR